MNKVLTPGEIEERKSAGAWGGWNTPMARERVEAFAAEPESAEKQALAHQYLCAFGPCELDSVRYTPRMDGTIEVTKLG